MKKTSQQSETVATRFVREVIQKTSEQSVRIEMSLTDAQDIAAVCRCIGGIPTGPRGAFDRLYGALTRGGVRSSSTVEQCERDGIPTAYFERKKGLV